MSALAAQIRQAAVRRHSAAHMASRMLALLQWAGARGPSTGRAAQQAAELSRAYAAGCIGGPGDSHLRGGDFTAPQALAGEAVSQLARHTGGLTFGCARVLAALRTKGREVCCYPAHTVFMSALGCACVSARCQQCPKPWAGCTCPSKSGQGMATPLLLRYGPGHFSCWGGGAL